MTKRSVLIVSACILLIVVIGLVFFHGRSDSNIESRALNVIDLLQDGNYQAALKNFRPGGLGSPDVLGQGWTKAVALFGPLKERTVIGTHVTNNAGGKGVPGKTVELSLVFEKGTLYGHIPFDSGNYIVDLKIDTHPADSDSQSDSVLVSRALSVFDSLQAGKYQEAEKDFHSIVKAKVSPENLGQLWTKTVTKFGPLKSRSVTGTYIMNNVKGNGVIPGVYKAVELDLVFERGTLHGHIPFDPNKEITGLSIR
ncbi:MAG: DUF3887 domain-containing protein [Armatimonadetes bacterium]|nr:DUF3887 domain-containing protein [Armatimonadota bacterium]